MKVYVVGFSMALTQIEETRAIYGAGHYEFAAMQKRFAVDSTRWYSWPEKRIASNVDFWNFRPGLTKTFEKQKSCRRKPLFRIKQRAVVPEKTEDCLEPSSRKQTTDSKKKKLT